ncbi:DUF1534 domain-containing protein, partial [Pseudomonas syringae pv. actinidiae]|nr:DUF1534 domain-containing protein [Pseudomonas syringae pv. actinidiae]
FLTLQRGNAVGDAPRHKSAPRPRTHDEQLISRCLPQSGGRWA